MKKSRAQDSPSRHGERFVRGWKRLRADERRVWIFRMKRPGDDRPDPPGGRAAERLRQFEEARLSPEERARLDREKARPGKRAAGAKRKRGKT